MFAWLRSPFLGWPAHPDPSAPDPDGTTVAAPAAGETAVLHVGPLAPSDQFTAHQLFYVFGIDGVGAMILSGGINFGIACAMYANQDVSRHPIRLFQLPNTLAGDGAVTIIVQCLITWVIELVLVTRDLRVGGVQPIGFVPAPQNPGRLLRALLALPDTAPSATTAVDDEEAAPSAAADEGTPQPDKSWSARRWAALLAAQVLAVAVPSFFLFWAPAVGILAAVGRRRFDPGWGWDWYFGRRWAPEVFKLLFGGLLALLTTPLFVLFWLVRCGWEVRREEAVDGDGDGDGTGTGRPASVSGAAAAAAAAALAPDGAAGDVGGGQAQ